MSDTDELREQENQIWLLICDDIGYLTYGNKFNNLTPDQRSRIAVGGVEIAKKIARNQQRIALEARIDELKDLSKEAEFVSHDRIDMVGMHIVINRMADLKSQLQELDK